MWGVLTAEERKRKMTTFTGAEALGFKANRPLTSLVRLTPFHLMSQSGGTAEDELSKVPGTIESANVDIFFQSHQPGVKPSNIYLCPPRPGLELQIRESHWSRDRV